MSRLPLLFASLGLTLLLMSFGAAVAGQNDDGKVCPNCIPKEQKSPGSSQIPAVASLLSRYMERQACKPTAERLASEAKAEFSRLFPANASSPTDPETDLFGIKLKSNAEEAALANAVLAPHPPNNWPAVASGCADVRCALTKLLGSEEAMQRVFTIAKKSAYIVSASQEFKAKQGAPAYPMVQFTLSEIQALDQALQGLPDSYKRLSRMKYFFRMPKNVIFEDDPKTAAEATEGPTGISGIGAGNITFADSTFNVNDPILTIDHELTHQRDFHEAASLAHVYLHDSSGFAALSGWQKGPKTAKGKDTWIHAPDGKFITNYAATSPFEDFAETGSYYVNQPKLLREVAPAKYEVFKNKVFAGQEFDSPPPGPLGTLLSDPKKRSETLQSCLKRFSHFSPSAAAGATESEIEFWENDPPLAVPDGFIHSSGRVLQSALYQTRCFYDAAESFAATLSPLDLCLAGGKAGIENSIRTEMVADLYAFLHPANVLLRSGKGPEIATRCLLASDLSDSCTQGGVQPLVHAEYSPSPALSKLPASDLTALEHEFMRLNPMPVPPASLVSSYISPAETAAACALGIDSTNSKSVPGTVLFAEPNSEGSYSMHRNIQELAGCRAQILAALAKKKVPIKADAIGLALASELLARPEAIQAVQGLQARFIAELLPAAAACKESDEKCRTDAVTKFLGSWMTSTGLKPTPDDIKRWTHTVRPVHWQ